MNLLTVSTDTTNTKTRTSEPFGQDLSRVGKISRLSYAGVGLPPQEHIPAAQVKRTIIT